MKNIANYRAEKYASSSYTEVAPDIFESPEGYVTSLSFEQETELDEGSSAADISQYPLEDVLDRFSVYISDFYEDLNTAESAVCRLEFCGRTAERIQRLRSIIGKHVFNRESEDVIDLVIE